MASSVTKHRQVSLLKMKVQLQKVMPGLRARMGNLATQLVGDIGKYDMTRYRGSRGNCGS